jgi:hypothetical protein
MSRIRIEYENTVKQSITDILIQSSATHEGIIHQDWPHHCQLCQSLGRACPSEEASESAAAELGIPIGFYPPIEI